VRRAAAAVTAVALALAGATAGPAWAAEPPAGTVPSAASAAWLAGLLTDGAVVDPALEVVDVDATLDLALGLVASGAAATTRDAVLDGLVADLDDHTGAALDATFVSATAKLVLVLAAADRDPRDAAGTDLVALLAGRVGTDGRATDRSDLGDLSTPRSQALAVLALVRTGGEAAVVVRAADALTLTACADGGVPAEFDAAPCTTDAVATALAAAALAAAADATGADAALTAARDDALAVLLALDAAGDLDPWAAGLTAAALRAADRGAEADAVTAALTAAVDGCDGDATAAVVRGPDPLRATVGMLLARSGATLTDLSAPGATPDAAPLACTSPTDDDASADDDPAAGDAGGSAVADGTAGTPAATADADGPRAGVAVAVAAGVLVLAVLAGVPVLRRARRRDAADRAAARGA